MGELEGLEGCEVFEDLRDHDRFLWVEQWQDRSQLEHRVNSGTFRALLGAMRVLTVENLVQVGMLEPRQVPGGAFHKRTSEAHPK